MFNFKPTITSVVSKIKKTILFAIMCLVVISMLVTPKSVPKKIFLPEEEALINFALDHNQCLSYGHIPDTFDYFNCMEKLQKQRQSITTI